jgi:hypothetical protein
MGMLVATLGKAACYRSGATMDCADDLAALSTLATWSPDEWSAIRYLCSVMRHQVGYHDTADRIATLPPLRRWATAVRRAPIPDDNATAAAAWLAEHGTDAHRSEVARWRDCRTCASGRLARLVIDLATAAGYRRAV